MQKEPSIRIIARGAGIGLICSIVLSPLVVAFISYGVTVDPTWEMVLSTVCIFGTICGIGGAITAPLTARILSRMSAPRVQRFFRWLLGDLDRHPLAWLLRPLILRKRWPHSSLLGAVLAGIIGPSVGLTLGIIVCMVSLWNDLNAPMSPAWFSIFGLLGAALCFLSGIAVGMDVGRRFAAEGDDLLR